jgi:hypothetical protein
MALSKKTKERIHRNKFYRSFYASLKTRDRKVIDEHFKRTYGTFVEVIFPTVVLSEEEEASWPDRATAALRDYAYQMYRDLGYKVTAEAISNGI